MYIHIIEEKDYRFKSHCKKVIEAPFFTKLLIAAQEKIYDCFVHKFTFFSPKMQIKILELRLKQFQEN